MKLSEAIEKGKSKNWLNAKIRRNPSTLKEWFVMLEDRKYQSSMLVDDEDNPISIEDLNEFVNLIEKIGIREFTVFL